MLFETPAFVRGPGGHNDASAARSGQRESAVQSTLSKQPSTLNSTFGLRGRPWRIHLNSGVSEGSGLRVRAEILNPKPSRVKGWQSEVRNDLCLEPEPQVPKPYAPLV